jgi:hypothetical protein
VLAADYLRDPFVRARIRQYLDTGAQGPSTCAWLHVRDATPEAVFRRVPVHELDQALASGAEIERPLWDEDNLLVHVDLEHVHFDRPDTTWQAPQACFEAQRPALKALKSVLGQHGIRPLHLLSGRGHHLVWKLRRDSLVMKALQALGGRAGIRPTVPLPPPVPASLAEAFRGLGMVMEFLGHEVLRRCREVEGPPLRLTAVEIDPGPGGREIISLDLSEYADPLQIRSIRVPFGPYLKPQRLAWSRGQEGPAQQDLVAVPLAGLDEETGLALMRDPARAARLARRARTRIPEQTAGMQRLLHHYQGSFLARFHAWYDSGAAVAPARLPRLPGCVEGLLSPQARLLCPAGLQLVTRTLLTLGWPPRHIAQLTAARVALLTGTSRHPPLFDPTLRADFYVRLFAGLVLGGTDGLADQTCLAYQRMGYCVRSDCRGRLDDLARSLRQRREGGWPAL